MRNFLFYRQNYVKRIYVRIVESWVLINYKTSYIVGPVPHEQVSWTFLQTNRCVCSKPFGYKGYSIVTPLKPFEAMYHSRPLVMSDLPALA